MTQTTDPLAIAADVARSVLNNVELARVNHHQPVNGAYDYFTVDFVGNSIVFKLPYHDDHEWWGGDYGVEIAALSDKAAKCCTAINDLLFNTAKDAALLARAA